MKSKDIYSTVVRVNSPDSFIWVVMVNEKVIIAGAAADHATASALAYTALLDNTTFKLSSQKKGGKRPPS